MAKIKILLTFTDKNIYKGKWDRRHASISILEHDCSSQVVVIKKKVGKQLNNSKWGQDFAHKIRQHKITNHYTA